ncbi:MAG: hypothetical protein WKF96_03325 [Solirubrobacteraceae bacterium]
MDEQNPEPQADPIEPQNEPEGHGNSEAAKWRRQLRETETERDGLRSQLDDRDRRDVEKMAAERLADPSDFWHGTTVDELRAEDGTIDVGKAEAELTKLIKAKPHYAAPVRVDLHQGVRQDVDRVEPPSFGDALRRETRGE